MWVLRWNVWISWKIKMHFRDRKRAVGLGLRPTPTFRSPNNWRRDRGLNWRPKWHLVLTWDRRRWSPLETGPTWSQMETGIFGLKWRPCSLVSSWDRRALVSNGDRWALVSIRDQTAWSLVETKFFGLNWRPTQLGLNWRQLSSNPVSNFELLPKIWRLINFGLYSMSKIK